jgi:hypothetical protein
VWRFFNNLLPTHWQQAELDYSPTFNNLQQQQSRQLAVGVQQSDMISVNLSARSNNYLHTDLRWLESHDIGSVRHTRYPQTQAIRQAALSLTHAEIRNSTTLEVGGTRRAAIVIHVRELLTVRAHCSHNNYVPEPDEILFLHGIQVRHIMSRTVA